MITEDYVNFETAKLLKEKEFDFCCEFQYINCSSGHPFLTAIRDDADCYYKNSEIGQDAYSAPTLQMAMKWLREKCYCHIVIDYTFKADANLSEEYVSYCYSVENAKTYIQYTHNEWYSTHEQACEAAIKYCLENLI